jgi:hypothetical protein
VEKVGVKCQWVVLVCLQIERKKQMGFMKIITAEGVQDIETMTVEQLLGLQVALMAEENK